MNEKAKVGKHFLAREAKERNTWKPDTDTDFVDEKVRITMAQDNSYECSEGQNRTDCQNVINEGGCLTCRECGWSKCD